MEPSKVLEALFYKLDLTNAQLVITDENTGAGYIIGIGDNVFARWTNYKEAIATLQAYIEADSKPNV
jgi:hypothetical protein